jgi:pimeloyl-ACP methyl ester carboxylesterase
MDRREFLAVTAAATAAAALPKAAGAQPVAPPSVKTVRTSILEIGYHESGPATGFPVLLFHGFPDDAHAYDGVAPVLAKAGYRAFAVYLRGYGPTRFLDPSSPRMAQQSAIAQDVIDFADALKLPRFAVSGYDWGGRASCITAALHPDRVRAAVLCGGYSIQNTITPGPPAPPPAVRNSWYQWYFNTETGREGLTRNRKALCRYMWQEWSPTWKFSDAMYEQTAASFENPDFVDCVLHSYRHRNFNAPSEPRFLDTEKRLATRPKVEVPTIVLHGGDDGFGKPAPETTDAERASFPTLVARRVVAGAGHFVPHEAPQAVADALIEVLAAAK